MLPTDYNTLFLHSEINSYLLSKNCDLKKFYYLSEYRNGILNSFFSEINSLFNSANFWVPSFNYDFCVSGIYDIQSSPSQLGVFSEFFRSDLADWRTSIPIFSIAGIGTNVQIECDSNLIDPFGENSIFGELVSQNGCLVNYGSSFSPTFIHYIERLHNMGPLYRYDKFFSGKVIDGDSSQSIIVNYHVIPKTLSIKYDTDKILSDLLKNGIAISLFGDNGYLVDAAKMLEFCLLRLDDNPFYLLKDETIISISPILENLGRRFEISDFNDTHRSFC